jgi:hypothetical protein
MTNFSIFSQLDPLTDKKAENFINSLSIKISVGQRREKYFHALKKIPL